MNKAKIYRKKHRQVCINSPKQMQGARESLKLGKSSSLLVVTRGIKLKIFKLVYRLDFMNNQSFPNSIYLKSATAHIYTVFNLMQNQV